MHKISSDSTEYLWVGISSKDPDGTEVDLSAESVSIAITTDDPGVNDWNAATWDGSSLRGGRRYYYAKLLIGDSGVSLAEGIYRVSIRVGSTAKTVPGGLQIT